MAKFSGAVGYAIDQETSPGVWTEVITEKNYFGDVNRDARRLGPDSEQLNDDISLSNSFSLVADGYAIENIAAMRYVAWNGQKWIVTDVEVRRPRLILQVGGLWNGNKA
jgi:hypothetical protein